MRYLSTEGIAVKAQFLKLTQIAQFRWDISI